MGHDNELGGIHELPEHVAKPIDVGLVQSGIDKNVQALNTLGSNARRDLMIAAVQDFRDAKALLGTGLDFLMGEGNLLF